MSINNNIANHDLFAENYDSQIKEYNSYGHDVLFGMCYEYVNPGESLLDLGIGTGLSSAHFADKGLVVTGLDGSGKMLEQCREKKFAKELIQRDLTNVPLPFPDHSFNNIICCGVFHFFGDLNFIFEETERIIKPGGIFAFTIAGLSKIEENSGSYDQMKYIQTPTAWGVPINIHTDNYINELMSSLNFEILKIQKVLSDSGDENSDDMLFKVIVCRKQG
ncbi:class I SAM-dependent DNA methyltransferase [Candidatus Cloacimonadota bacterium]